MVMIDSEELSQLRLDAARFNALINHGRLRIIGQGGSDTPYWHIGIEHWIMHPGKTDPNTKVTLTEYCDFLIDYAREEHAVRD